MSKKPKISEKVELYIKSFGPLGVSLSDVKDQFDLKPNSASNLISRLVKKGLILKEKRPITEKKGKGGHTFDVILKSNPLVTNAPKLPFGINGKQFNKMNETMNNLNLINKNLGGKGESVKEGEGGLLSMNITVSDDNSVDSSKIEILGTPFPGGDILKDLQDNKNFVDPYKPHDYKNADVDNINGAGEEIIDNLDKFEEKRPFSIGGENVESIGKDDAILPALHGIGRFTSEGMLDMFKEYNPNLFKLFKDKSYEGPFCKRKRGPFYQYLSQIVKILNTHFSLE